jgi:monofunctional biosynthetic peptidoglycan transglycosylase
MRRLRRLLRALLGLIGGVIGAALLYLAGVWVATPSVGALAAGAPRETAFSRARGQALGTWTPLEEISPLLACAIVKAEDRTFFRHHGFDWSQLHKAFDAALGGRVRMGGSTISQQLAKNLFFGPEPSLHRKLREAFATRALEGELPKRRILALYLNVIELGDGVWGVGDGARRRLGRSAASLGAFEATLLAGLVAAPRAPLAGPNLERLGRLQQRVLHQLYFSGLLDERAWLSAADRAQRLTALLRAGRPLTAALDETADPSPPPTSSLTLRDAIDGECGLARELEQTERFHARFAQR